MFKRIRQARADLTLASPFRRNRSEISQFPPLHDPLHFHPDQSIGAPTGLLPILHGARGAREAGTKRLGGFGEPLAQSPDHVGRPFRHRASIYDIAVL